MRFRAKLVDIGCIHHLTKVVNSIGKLAKICVLRLTQQKLYFVLRDNVADGGIRVWCELTQANFFDEFALAGVSAETNEIYLEVELDSVVRALKTAASAKMVKVKLTNKRTPCLTFDIELPSLSLGQSRHVLHDVPVNVLPRRLWPDYQEPDMPDFDVSIYMPPLKAIRNVVDRMKNISNFLELSANQAGEMKLMVRTDMVSVATHFKQLPTPKWANDKDASQMATQTQRAERDPSAMAKARIDIKKFSNFLTGQNINPTRVICNIVHKKIIHFFLLHDDLSLQYFMPVAAY